MTSGEPDLSIVIPAFNEESRLPRALEKIREYFSRQPGGLDNIEVLVVDDGSSDATARIAQEWAARFPACRLVSNGQNHGKGYSVRHGMLKARGRIALFTDAD
ncbi:MAG TPA: glycosyltransferase, partial [Candidatus Acidoferrales bacterium]|nr:glycosyltransferase [Candidatus Acidoferrales bacterium]